MKTKKLTVKQVRELVKEVATAHPPGHNPAAKEVRSVLTDMSRQLARLADTVMTAETRGNAPDELDEWRRIYDAVKAAENAVDEARHLVYRLG